MNNQTTNVCIDVNYLLDVLREDQVDLTGYIKTGDQAEQELSNFEYWLQYDKNDDLADLDPTPFKINFNVIIELLSKLDLAPCSINIRALEIAFGLVNDRVVFFFTPLALKRSVRNPATPQEIQYNTVERHPTTYIYDGTTLVSANAGEMQAQKANYEEKMWIQRHRWSDFYLVDPNTGDWKSDTLSVIFSFQEILHLYRAAYPCGEDNKDLFIYNGAANYKHWMLNLWRRKHNLFITLSELELVTEENDLAATSGEAANLAHLCPPNCLPIYKINKTNCP